MLSPYRVLDLTDECGLLAGQILADLGADVVQVEPPGGSTARRVGPFAGDDPDPERSLFWWAYTRNKRGVTCAMETAAGQALLRRLAARADVLIESAPPGAMRARGLDYAPLAADHPALVYASITAYGQTGPLAGAPATDLTLLAAGGPLILGGEPGRPPVRMAAPQAFLHASADAADGILIALHARRHNGRGQHVDAAAQDAVTQATQAQILAAAVGEREPQRNAGGVAVGPVSIRFIREASDGYVSLPFLFGNALGPFTRRFMEWVHEEGFCDAATRDIDWISYGERLVTGAEPPEAFRRVEAAVVGFLRSKTKAELFRVALERSLLIAPVMTARDVVENPQFEARDYWRDVARPDGGGTVRFPGPFISGTPRPMTYRRPPPRLGEHNAEVYADWLGLDAAAVAALRAEGAI